MNIEHKLEQTGEEAEKAAAANDQQKSAKLSQEQHLATCPVGSVDWADCCCGDAF